MLTGKEKVFLKYYKLTKIINNKGIKSKLTIIGLKKKIDDKNINFVDFINKITKTNDIANISKSLLKYFSFIIIKC